MVCAALSGRQGGKSGLRILESSGLRRLSDSAGGRERATQAVTVAGNPG